MVDERVAALREMAKHRGYTLKTSRRRKPGGDFGRFGLEDAQGKAALGIGAGGLDASAGEVEAFLRNAERATWATSTAGVARIRTPSVPKPPTPKPRPRFKVTVGHLLTKLPSAKRGDVVTELLATPGARIERLVSSGRVTSDHRPLVQDHPHWLLLLAGEAAVRVEDSDEVALSPGAHVTIAKGQPYRVTRASVDPPAVWIVVHL